MAKYIGPKCKLSRREGTDLQLKSGVKPLDSKCKIDVPPGQHGAKRARLTGYGTQLRSKQMIKRIYGLLERQFRKYYFEAARSKGATGEVLLQILESRLDNVVYRLGFASTRREARQLVNHKAVLVNDATVNIPSYQIKPGDKISIREKSKAQLRIKAAVEISQVRKPPEWLDVNDKDLSGVFKFYPERSDLPAEYNEQQIVELYSK